MTSRSLLISRIGLGCVMFALSITASQIISGFYGSEQTSGRVLYGVIFPALPFMVLCIFTLARCEGRFVFSVAAIMGATVGALAAIAFPWVLLRYASAHYRGGGVNFGLGFVLLLLPLYLPVAMLVGAWFSRALWLYLWEWRHCQPSDEPNGASPRRLS